MYILRLVGLFKARFLCAPLIGKRNNNAKNKQTDLLRSSWIMGSSQPTKDIYSIKMFRDQIYKTKNKRFRQKGIWLFGLVK